MSSINDNERFRKLLLSYPARAIEELYDRYYHNLIHIANKFTHDQTASQDIVQETIAHVWKEHKQLGRHHDQSIFHYLVRVVKYKAITHYKENLRFSEFKVRYLDGYPLTGSPVEISIIEAEVRQEIRNVIAKFPKREQECLLLKMDEELTIEQMATKLNVSKKAVERSLTSARKRFRKYWSDR